jgi:hypothetical protein
MVLHRPVELAAFTRKVAFDRLFIGSVSLVLREFEERR